MTDAEIAGYMNWSGPGAYTQHSMRRVKRMLEAAISAEREACAKVCEEEICGCCWEDDAQEAANHLADAIRARGTP